MNTFQQQDVQIASLGESLDRVYRALLRTAELPTPAQSAADLISREPCFALYRLECIFGLSSFERDLLLLCAGASLESRFVSACAAAHHNPAATWPTFGLALATLDNPHWSVISRARPLRHWRLIEAGDAPLVHAPLRIDERILQFLIGVPTVDERLEALVRVLDVSSSPGARNRYTHQPDVINLAVRHWKRPPFTREPLLLVSNRSSIREAAFIEICRRTELRPCSLHASDIPATPAEREQFARIWMREFALDGTALSIKTEDSENIGNLRALLNLLETPVAVEVHPGSTAEHLDGLRLHLAALPAPDRKKIWTEQLGPIAQQMNGHLDRIIEQFQFDEPDIQISARAAREEIAANTSSDAGRLTWHICRQHARRSLDNLAQRLRPRGVWDDLVLPAKQLETLRQIVVHVRQRAVVNEDWGFAARYERGLGLSVLFTGTSGTGKTMAAEIIAGELDLDLYRIDLASVVSKYIGETEKNLRKIFDAAEESSAILLFDEADALFGKRSEVRDSHDRYANLEISYLLQRIESYRGVAILTTNMQHALDSAFMRRIRFIVQFPFPDIGARARIWQRIFPAATPVGPLDFDRLAQLNVSGGVIRNIATHAAFLAAEDQTPVDMKHLVAASRTEYSKMDKPLTGAETRGWV
ncbi:MAG TPA: ATP-binding protein [Acidobacteriaceae bacterium]